MMKKYEDILRVAAAFVLSQLAGVLLMAAFRGLSPGYGYAFLLNIICVLVVNTAVHFAICGRISLPQKNADYSRFEPFAFLFVAVLFSCLVTFVIKLLPLDMGSSSEKLSGIEFWLNALYTVVLAPLSEELAFRGAVLSRLSERRERAAAVISALFFAAYHMSLAQFPYTFVLGYFLAVLALRSGSVVPCILVHAANNLLSLVAGYCEAAAPVIDISVPVLGAAGLVWLVVTGRLWRKKRNN